MRGSYVSVPVVIAIDLVCHLNGDSASVARGLAMVRRRLQAASSGGPPPVVGLRGPSDAQLRLVQSLVVTGLRLKVRIVSHLRVAEVPLSSCATRVCQAADRVVVESSFGARAVQYALRHSGMAHLPPVVIVPPAVAPADARAPLSGRHALRIGTRASHSGDADAFEALEIFRAFAKGLYWICHDCHRLSPFVIGEHLEPIVAAACPACGSVNGARGEVLADARLVIGGRPLHDQPVADRPALWTLRTAATALGIADQIIWDDPDLTIAPDALLLPHQHADLSFAVLDGCSAGIVTLTTDFGAAGGLPPGVVRLVPPGQMEFAPNGHWVAPMDVGSAISVLRSLSVPQAHDA